MMLADQFCQSVLADRLPKCTKTRFWCDAPRAFDGGTGVGHPWCAGFLGISLLTLFRFATIIMSNEWA